MRLAPGSVGIVWLLVGCAPVTAGPAGKLDALHEELARDSGNAMAHLRLGLHWARAGDGLRAQQYLERSWQLGADARLALPPLIRVDLALSSWEAALRHSEALADALQHRCSLPGGTAECAAAAETLAATAALQDSLGRSVRARDLFEASLRVDPGIADAYLGLARVQAEAFGDRRAAVATLQRGLRDARQSPARAQMRARLDALETEGDR